MSAQIWITPVTAKSSALMDTKGLFYSFLEGWNLPNWSLHTYLLSTSFFRTKFHPLYKKKAIVIHKCTIKIKAVWSLCYREWTLPENLQNGRGWDYKREGKWHQKKKKEDKKGKILHGEAEILNKRLPFQKLFTFSSHSLIKIYFLLFHYTWSCTVLSVVFY